MAIEVFEPEEDPGVEPEVFEFAMIFKRDGVREQHEFQAIPRYDWQNLRSLMYLLDSRRGDSITPQMLAQVDRLIRRSLRNDDGTPEKWQPRIVDDDAAEPWFTDPNGDNTPAELLPAYTTFDAGSSRRRWTHLIEVDDDVTVDASQVTSLMQRLIEVAGKDRPRRSGPSPGSPRIERSGPTSAVGS